MSRFSPIDYGELLSLGTSMLEGLDSKINSAEIPGEWKSFIVPFSCYKQSVVGLNSAINALLYNDEQRMAKGLYNSALEFGMPNNRYVEERLT